MAWTEQQSEAITTRDCGLIVSAAAGSGKTSVLVERLLRILEDETPEHRVPADRMIVVTFTNDAAAEMRSRLYQALDDQLQKQPENQWLYQQQVCLQNAHICTISSFCFDLIRDNLTEQGITAGFRILNETEAKLIASKAADTVLNRCRCALPASTSAISRSYEPMFTTSSYPVVRSIALIWDIVGYRALLLHARTKPYN